MKYFILFFIIVIVTFCFSNEPSQLRKPLEIKVGKITLEKILNIHNDGLKQIDKTKNKNDINFIKDKLNTYLKKKSISIDYLKETDLSNVDLKNLDLRYLNLKESNLTNTDLTNTNLEGANLKEALVYKAKFVNSNLKEVDIHEAEGLTLNQLLTCKSLYKTKLPEEISILVKKEKPRLLAKDQ